jgi:ABC-type lipoprotein release transport system permease subunit
VQARKGSIPHTRLEWFVARRLLGARKQSYVALVSSVSTWGLALGVASLIVIFSVTSGFEEVFREKILGVYPHLVVIGKGGDLPDWQHVQATLAGADHLTSAAPATYDEMMASHLGRRGGCIVKGIMSATPTIAATITPFLVDGSLDGLSVEPRFALVDHRIVIPPLPGGSSYLLVVPSQGPLMVEQDLAEEEQFPRIRILSAATLPTDLVFAGLLSDLDFTMAPGGLTNYLDLPDGKGELQLLDETFPFVLEEGNATLVMDAEPAPRLLVVPAPPPGPSTSPGRVSVANLGDTPITLVAAQGELTVAPGTQETLTVTATRRAGVLLGQELASRIEARIGDEIRLVSPLYAVPGMGHTRRSGRTIADSFTVTGILSLGFYEYDSKLAVIDFGAAQRFLHQGDSARWVEIRVDDLFASTARATELGRFLSGFSLLDIQENVPSLFAKYASAARGLPAPESPMGYLGNVEALLRSVKFSNLDGEMTLGYRDDYRIITWQEMNKPLFTSMKRQRIVLSLFFLIIIVVAAFNIVSSQIMIVREKQGDIAILKAMGASGRQIQRIFLIQGMTVGILGTLAGLLVALVIAGLLHFVGFPLDPQVYFVSKLPIHLRLTDVVMACGISLVAIYVAVLFAARAAANKAPVEGLRELE